MNNLNKKILKSSLFNIYSIQNKNLNCQNKSLKVFFEGDGLSWISKNRISSNPTPINPIGLKLMIKDKSSCKIYLARPCQFISSNTCERKYWTSHRFNEKIINSYLQILDNIKSHQNNKSFEFVGYSGGGAIATLLTAKRNDVIKLVTYAGNLDIVKWTDIHNISPLKGSLNPVDFTSHLEVISQIHYVGKYDKIMPIHVFKSYQSKFGNTTKIKLILLDSNHINILN